jgi:hypothetical protein
MVKQSINELSTAGHPALISIFCITMVEPVKPMETAKNDMGKFLRVCTKFCVNGHSDRIE